QRMHRGGREHVRPREGELDDARSRVGVHDERDVARSEAELQSVSGGERRHVRQSTPASTGLGSEPASGTAPEGFVPSGSMPNTRTPAWYSVTFAQSTNAVFIAYE